MTPVFKDIFLLGYTEWKEISNNYPHHLAQFQGQTMITKEENTKWIHLDRWRD
jgi:hypothetical protein